MTLLEILLHELESWPEGKEYAFQSATNSMAFFSASHKDGDPESIQLCRIASNRGSDHKVTREEWETAKIKSLPFFHTVADVLGEEGAVKELQVVDKINYAAKRLVEAFVFGGTPQGFRFWKDIFVSEPSRGSELKHALDTITAAMTPGHFIRLHSDGSGSVRASNNNNEIIHFTNTKDLVDEYLDPPPKFEHWHLLTEEIKWIAKDSDGRWWAYTDKPIMARDEWYSNDGKCRSLDVLKVDIPCHWSRSLIERPSH